MKLNPLLAGILALLFLVACTRAEQKAAVKIQDSTSVRDTSDSTGTLDTTGVPPFAGDTMKAVADAMDHIETFDKAAATFKRDTFSLEGMSSEGGQAIAVYDRTSPYYLIDGVLYGEMGKIGFRFYLLDLSKPKLIIALFTNTLYDKPMYLKDMKIKEVKTRYDIFHDNSLIMSFEKGQPLSKPSSARLKEMEAETKRFFKACVSQIAIVK